MGPGGSATAHRCWWRCCRPHDRLVQIHVPSPVCPRDLVRYWPWQLVHVDAASRDGGPAGGGCIDGRGDDYALHSLGIDGVSHLPARGLRQRCFSVRAGGRLMPTRRLFPVARRTPVR